MQANYASYLISLGRANNREPATRLAAIKLHNNLIEATIITGKYKDEDAKDFDDSDGYVIRIQTVAVSSSIGVCNDNKKSTRPVTSSLRY